ncbi:MAG: hypothetical protein QOG91_614 [Candidatus Parcubacteria bacterium]|jgi:tRNA G18 (ribose-2'-O)-methylase SpoU|nr:hypothetical protein [Candidatus Parcubacteria bacterium]
MISKKIGSRKCDVRLLLVDIRSVHNVGSIFRTAETLGVSKIYCAGTTPVPLDRFKRKRKDLAKVALGAEELVPWEYVSKPAALVRKLKDEDFQVVAVEQSKRSVDYKRVRLRERALVILGNEVTGLPAQFLRSADVIAEIPLNGKKESLNVSVAAGVALYRMLGQ